jgi:hypothetical protein
MPPQNLASVGSIGDGSLGSLPASNTGIKMVIGVSSLGTPGTIYSFRGTDVASVLTQLGKGPAVDDIVGHLIRSGGKTVRYSCPTSSTAATNSAVTNVGGGPAVTVTGTADDDYDSCQEEITLGGALGVGTFRYTLDGGDTWSDDILLAATYLLPNGITLNHAAGTYILGATNSWSSVGPAMTVGNIGTAMDVAIASPLSFGFFHIVGHAADASAAATLAATVSSKITAAHAAHKYVSAIIESPPVTAASIVTAFASFTDRFMMRCDGYFEFNRDRTDIVGAQILKRSSARVIVPRLSRNPLSNHPVQNATESGLDPVLPDSAVLVPSGNTSGDASGFYDENASGILNDARGATLRTFDGRAGAYVSNVPMLSSPTSPVQQFMDAAVLLLAATTFYQESLDELGKKVRTNPDGTLTASAADSIRDHYRQVVKAAVGPHSDDADVVPDTTNDVKATGILKAKISVVKSTYVLEFDWEVALTRGLSQAA